jgi:outer membrane receptor protein involved in Fe transport
LFDLSLDELSKVEIKSDITSIKAKPIREQPGIVSVVTQPQIIETGARDLSDILMLVPGFSLDSDVQSMVGLTFRGLQGQEGKVLLVVDGIEINEPLYGSLPILNFIPAEVIDQVEIIRGPGSAMYGGSAGLAVIRVTTKGADQNGGYGVVTPSYADGRFSVDYSGGMGFATNDWRFSCNASYGDYNLSNQKYTSLSGTNLDLTHKSDMNPLFLDLDAGWRDLDFRFIYDDYQYQDPVNYGDPPAAPSEVSFDSILASVKYEAQPASWLKITPEFTYRHQTPWDITSDVLGDYKIDVDRYQADLVGVVDLTANSSLMVGMRYFRDVANAVDDAFDGQPASIYYNGASSVSYNDLAGFAQYDLDTRWVNVSVGGRYEYYTPVDGHFVPRIALTKAWEKFHLKALYSQASRIPGINVVADAVGGKLVAEQTVNYELEAGYRFTDSLSWVANVFYMEVEHPIIFTDSGGGGDSTEGYFNAGKISTAGVESDLRWDRPKFSTALSYSFYRAIDNDVDYVRGDADTFLAAPAHKVTLSETWHVNKSLDCNLNGYWISAREVYAYPASGVTSLDPAFVLNAFVNYKFKHFSAGLGLANLLDQNLYAPQPYAGGSGPLPLKGREIFVRLAFKF